MKLGANMNITDADGNTPLCMAAKHHCGSSMRLLDDAGAAKTGLEEWTALHWAAACGSTADVVVQLDALQQPPRLQWLQWIMTKIHKSTPEHSRSRPTTLNEGLGGNGPTALGLAAENGHTDIVCKLLEAGASIDKPDWSGDTPLLAAVTGNHLETVQELLKRNPILETRSWLTSLLQVRRQPIVLCVTLRDLWHCLVAL